MYSQQVCLLFLWGIFFSGEKKKKGVSVEKKHIPGPQAGAESKGNIFV